MRSVPAFSSNAANLRKEVPIDKQISPEKCYVDYGPSNFIVYRDDGTWQNTQGFGPLAEAFPQLANLPKCTIPTSATISIHSSGDHPRLVGHVSRAAIKHVAHFPSSRYSAIFFRSFSGQKAKSMTADRNSSRAAVSFSSVIFRPIPFRSKVSRFSRPFKSTVSCFKATRTTKKNPPAAKTMPKMLT